jgi:putative transposase
MVAIVREADKSSGAEVAGKHKVSEQTLHVWRKGFGMLEANDVKRLRSLEAENAKLKKLVVESDFEIDTLMEINRRKW